MNKEQTRILFVCHGNICRSPMAEFVMKKLVRDISSSAKHVTTNSALTAADFEIASAATSTVQIGN
jgi:protein-tyrosine phosphatase